MNQKIKVEKMEIPSEMGFGGRIETGAVEFTYPITERQKAAGIGPFADWTGLFIRGDDCARLSCDITALETYFMDKSPHDLMVSQALWHLQSIKEIISGDVIHKGHKTELVELKNEANK